MESDDRWAAFVKASEKIKGTTSHFSRWPRSVVLRPEGDGATIGVYARQPPHDRLVPPLDAEEVDRLIMTLCALRAGMKPRVPVKRPAQVPLAVSSNVRVRARQSELGIALDIRTDGLSWMSVLLSPSELDTLRSTLAGASRQPPPGTPWPRGGGRVGATRKS